ncbi:RagB/SusD family nutrient uptake outer membrane protein [Pedobacter chitinilyticus]|uniref:RagB/SusD family nutrient uptake outer membrane protein n=1 Tax=Pedobacter chitinilyticus TaxID=2233776 RepID=A0A3S3PSJ7_9SPHI|nr:RagB/SusD family nutrient uptake outer membrane protein [Pedobacter chitinilyticus]RWU04859.1 RagB/SusD family nutrient uptake outer membrane protein [Pedobacter chitinilyticus]
MNKLIYKITLMAMLVFSFASCKKFLEKEPIGKVGKQVLFEDVNGAQLGLVGAYRLVLDYNRDEFGMHGDVASDNMVYTPTPAAQFMGQSFNFSSTPEDDALVTGHIWLSVFEALNNVNNVLNALPALKEKFPDQLSQIETIEGQALVLRALCHFDLSKVYAQPYNFTADASHLGVPVLTKTPSPGENVVRRSMKQTYDQILLDITSALPLLNKYNNFTNQALVNYQAALGLLSRVYLYKGDWQNCLNTSNLVIADTRYKLATATEYKSLYSTYTPNANTSSTKSEILFQLSGASIEKVSITELNVIFASQYGASSKLLNTFDADDIRKTQLFNTLNSPRIYTTKYTAGAYAIKVVRLSEVYLNRAEANWNLKKYDDAKEDLRVISQRAHPNQTINIGNPSPDDLYRLIAEERNRELCFEGHRLYDLVRRKESLTRGVDCNSTVCTLTYPNDKFVLPITTKELDANKGMKQNPGYN